MRHGKPLLLALGAVLALVGLGFLAVGLGATWAHGTARDGDGYYTSPDVELTTDSAAITTGRIELDARPTDWWPDPGDLPVRVTVTPADGADPVFVGIGDADDVEAYLAGVDQVGVTRLGPDGEVTYDGRPGDETPAPPGEQDLWLASSVGEQSQVLTVDPTPGDWQLVVMNADGSPGVDVVASAGVRTGVLLPVGMGLLAVALLVLGVATVTLVAAAAVRDTAPDMAAPDPGPPPPVSRRVHPVALEGRLDPQLSRGLWLVKWVLLVPHLVVLALLWVAFVLMTVVAGLAILVTGRYPRAIFDVNVGVLRWSWRVAYYGYGVLGTDRYPPFSLAADPDYPATLDIPYPEQLSRGLVLVKSWLLAIPHLVVVGIFTGGLVSWTVDAGPDGAEVVTGTGLIGVLVLVAGVVLLVTGRYPRGLFDLLMGLQRWVYRVVAYVALMTDEYPPFRLDSGGREPAMPPRDGPPSPTTQGDDRRDVAHA